MKRFSSGNWGVGEAMLLLSEGQELEVFSLTIEVCILNVQKYCLNLNLPMCLLVLVLLKDKEYKHYGFECHQLDSFLKGFPSKVPWHWNSNASYIKHLSVCDESIYLYNKNVAPITKQLYRWCHSDCEHAQGQCKLKSELIPVWRREVEVTSHY